MFKFNKTFQRYLDKYTCKQDDNYILLEQEVGEVQL